MDVISSDVKAKKKSHANVCAPNDSPKNKVKITKTGCNFHHTCNLLEKKTKTTIAKATTRKLPL